MAKAPTPSEPVGPTERCIRVTAPGGPHWRAGKQFGREAVLLGEGDIEAMAKAKGVTPDAVVDLLRSDPQLAIVPAERPVAAPDAPAS